MGALDDETRTGLAAAGAKPAANWGSWEKVLIAFFGALGLIVPSYFVYKSKQQAPVVSPPVTQPVPGPGASTAMPPATETPRRPQPRATGATAMQSHMPPPGNGLAADAEAARAAEAARVAEAARQAEAQRQAEATRQDEERKRAQEALANRKATLSLVSIEQIHNGTNWMGSSIDWSFDVSVNDKPLLPIPTHRYVGGIHLVQQGEAPQRIPWTEQPLDMQSVYKITVTAHQMGGSLSGETSETFAGTPGATPVVLLKTKRGAAGGEFRLKFLYKTGE